MAGDFPTSADQLRVIIREELEAHDARVAEAVAALREAESGLWFAGADVNVPRGRFIPAPTLALITVRAALALFPAKPSDEPAK